MSITFYEDVWSKCNLLLKLLWIIEILTEKTVLCFRNTRVVSKEKDQLMSFQDKILDLSWFIFLLNLKKLLIFIVSYIWYFNDIYVCWCVFVTPYRLRLLQSKVLGGGYNRFSTISNFSHFTAQFSPPSKTKSPVTCERCVNIPNPK